MRLRPLNSRCRPRGLTTAPESRCEPGAFPFSSTATGTSPSRSAAPGSPPASWPSRIAAASPAGPAPTTRKPTSIRSSTGSVGAGSPPPTTTAAESRPAGRSRPPRADELGQLRHDLVQVADDAEVGELEDRRVRILVDRDDHARALHPDLVLDRARDPDRDVELRRDGLAGLADLRRVRVPAGVDDRARRRDRAAERCASSSTSENFSGSPSPRPPATITSASSIDGPLLGVRLLDQLGARREVLELDRASLTSAVPPTRPRRTCPRGRSRARPALDQPTST